MLAFAQYEILFSKYINGVCDQYSRTNVVESVIMYADTEPPKAAENLMWIFCPSMQTA